MHEQNSEELQRATPPTLVILDLQRARYVIILSSKCVSHAIVGSKHYIIAKRTNADENVLCCMQPKKKAYADKLTTDEGKAISVLQIKAAQFPIH